MTCVSKHHDLQMFNLKLNNFHTLEVVGRGSGSQLPVGEKLIIQISGLKIKTVISIQKVYIILCFLTFQWQ